MIEAFIECGCEALHVKYSADADIGGAFKAVCQDTGETLLINGWMIESIEVID